MAKFPYLVIPGKDRDVYKPLKTFTAANGQQFTGYKERVKMFFDGEVRYCDFYFSVNIPVKAPIILGQTGFFDQHKVIFNLPEKELEVI